MNLLVTGGAGFIGSNLIEWLLSSAESETGVKINRVVNLDKLTYAGSLLNLTDVKDDRLVFAEGDIVDGDFVLDLLKTHEIDGILHLAAESHVDRSIDGPEAFINTNVVGTFRLLEAFRRRVADGAKIRFLHVSTDEVYGSLSPTDPAFTEETPYSPNSPYSASKAASDHLARAYHHTYGLDIVTTNCSNNYGPKQFPEKLIPLMILKALNGEKLPVYGDGSNVRDWLYVTDHARGLLAAFLKGKAGETYNLGGRNEVKNLEVVQRVLTLLREAGHPQASDDLISYVTDRPGHDWRYAINCDKSARDIDWTPRHDFESGLAATVRWYLDHGVWIDAIRAEKYQGQRLGV